MENKDTGTSSKRLAYLGLFFVILVWGISPLLTLQFYKYYSPTIRICFCNLTGVIMLLFISRKNIKRLSKQYFLVGIPTGVSLALADILQKIGEQGFAALVAVPNPLCLEAYSKLQLPVTFFDYNIHKVNIPSVVCDEYAGSCAAVDYLVRIGCRNIAYIGGLYSPTSEDRLQGCLDRLAKYELPIRQAWIIRDIPTREAGESAARMLFESGDPVPDAVLCNNDAVAAGVIRYFSQSGRPPCPLVGFGNTSRAEELGICSVEQHVDRIADMILRNLQMQFSGEKPPLKTVIPTNLIVR